MTRPRKQTVDYFPHSCNHGQTMFVLEQKFGNDGYAFWFKLLELLGKTEGHSLDCNKMATWHYLCTLSRVSDGTAIEILNLLSEVDAIDKDLWEKSKIIWSDNFVNGLSFAYRNRGVSIPAKPVIYIEKPPISGTTTHRKPQMKVNEMKVNEMKEKPLVAGKPATISFSPQNLAAFWNEKAPPELSRVNLPLKRSPKAMEKIKDALKRNPDPEWWAQVIQRMFKSPFLRGEKGWKADLDFMVRKAEEIVDGKYDGGGRTMPKSLEGLRDYAQRGTK